MGTRFPRTANGFGEGGLFLYYWEKALYARSPRAEVQSCGDQGHSPICLPPLSRVQVYFLQSERNCHVSLLPRALGSTRCGCRRGQGRLQCSAAPAQDPGAADAGASLLALLGGGFAAFLCCPGISCEGMFLHQLSWNRERAASTSSPCPEFHNCRALFVVVWGRCVVCVGHGGR